MDLAQPWLTSMLSQLDQSLAENAFIQTQLRERLNNLKLSNEANRDKTESCIESAKLRLEAIKEGEGQRLIQLVSETDASASRMSEAIRRLDAEQARVLETLQLLGRVEHIKELVTNLGEADGLDAACDILHEIAQFSEASTSAYEKRYPQETRFNDFLELRRKSLLNEIFAQLDVVLASDSVTPQRLNYIFDLLTKIDHTKEGIVRYSSFLNHQAQETFDSLVASIDAKKDLSASNQLSRLFEFVSNTLSWTFENVIVGELVGRADYKQIVFWSFAQVVDEAVERIVDKYTLKLAEPSVDLFRHDLLVAECVLIIRAIGDLIAYFRDTCFTINSESIESPELVRIRSSVLSKYPSLELDYVRSGIVKALELNQVLEDDHLGSCVDDTLFLCKKALLRGLSTESIPAFFRLVRGLAELLKDPFSKTLEASIKAGVHASDSLEKKRNFAFTCNCFTAASELLQKLLDEILYDYADALSNEEATDLAETFNLSRKCFDALADAGMQTLYRGLVKSKYTSHLASLFKEAKYACSSEADLETDSLVHRYTTGHTAILAEAVSLVTDESKRKLLEIVASELVSFWIKSILRSKFNLQGAFLLDRQIRSISFVFIEDSDLRVKSAFKALAYSASILVCDTRAEAQELASQFDTDQRLLTLRVDW